MYENARSGGFDECVTISPDGSLWEGSRSNLFVVMEDQILTPPCAGKVLPGIMRSLILERGAKLGLDVREAALSLLDRLLPAGGSLSEQLGAGNHAGASSGARPAIRRRGQSPGGSGMTFCPGSSREGRSREDRGRAGRSGWRISRPRDWPNPGTTSACSGVIPAAGVGRLMTCLTVTRITAEEAVAEQAGLIVSHHPVLFRAVKRIRADLPDTAPFWILARAGIAVASPHTAFDSTAGGINEGLCRRLGLVDVAPLRPLAAPASYKIVVFTPESDRQAVLAGAFEAGAGRIGAYTECSFAIPGQGTFFGTEETNPTVGQKGRRETVEELRLEIICPGARLAAVLGGDPGATLLRRAGHRRLSTL